MTSLDQLREARMPCFACDGSRSHAIVLPVDEELIDAVIPCEPCQSAGTVLVFRDSLWRECFCLVRATPDSDIFYEGHPHCPECLNLSVPPTYPYKHSENCRLCKGTNLEPKHYDSDLEAVGPVLADAAKAEFVWTISYTPGRSPTKQCLIELGHFWEGHFAKAWTTRSDWVLVLHKLLAEACIALGWLKGDEAND